MVEPALRANSTAAALTRRHRDWTDVLFTALMWTCALLITAVFFWILGDLLLRGLPYLSLDFLFSTPMDAGRSGGIASIMVSTLWILLVCMSVSIPLGIGTAVLLSEFIRHNLLFGRAVRFSLDVLAGVPSIVFGLFGNAFFSLYLDMGFSILSGGLTLACMVLPLLIRATETALRAVPDDFRTAATALGIPAITTLWRILLPAAAPGIIAGLVLGIGRALAETAALLYTSGYVDRMPGSLLDSGRSLSIHIYDLAMNVPGAEGNAYASALVLIVMLLIINVLTFRLVDGWLHQRITTH